MSINEIVQRVANDMISLEKENKKLKEQNEELRKEVERLENKYAWGLQPIDYALAKYGSNNKLQNLTKDEYCTKKEMSDEELYRKIIKEMSYHDVQIFGWNEVIDAMEFTPKLEKLLKTLAKRDRV